jgi:hypothetical protein
MPWATPAKEDPAVRALKLPIVVAALAAGAIVTAPAMAAAPESTVPVCNEAENSFHGGYTVSGGIVDPNPPAFLRGEQMRLGNGHGAGLLNAAQHSPALRECGAVDGGGDGGDGGGGIT